MDNAELISDKAKSIVKEVVEDMPPVPAEYWGRLLGDISMWAGRMTAKKFEPLDEQHLRQLVGARIKKARQTLGLKQVDVAKKLAVSTALITAYETGARAPSLKNLVALTQVLNVSSDWLLGLH